MLFTVRGFLRGAADGAGAGGFSGSAGFKYLRLSARSSDFIPTTVIRHIKNIAARISGADIKDGTVIFILFTVYKIA